jgi:uncharacterized protein YraI
MAQAQGQLAYTAKTVNLRAGPARDYPIVATLPPRFQVAVQGCLPDYTWCDVIAGPSRGWMYAGNINYAYQNTYVPVLNYGAVIGIGVLAFVLDDYWGRHYHNRSWYGDRHRWANRPAPAAPRYHRPPPQPGVIGPRGPSGGVYPGVRPSPQPGTARAPRSQPRVAPGTQAQPPAEGGGSGWRPSDARRQGRTADQ